MLIPPDITGSDIALESAQEIMDRWKLDPPENVGLFARRIRNEQCFTRWWATAGENAVANALFQGAVSAAEEDTGGTCVVPPELPEEATTERARTLLDIARTQGRETTYEYAWTIAGACTREECAAVFLVVFLSQPIYTAVPL